MPQSAVCRHIGAGGAGRAGAGTPGQDYPTRASRTTRPAPLRASPRAPISPVCAQVATPSAGGRPKELRNVFQCLAPNSDHSDLCSRSAVILLERERSDGGSFVFDEDNRVIFKEGVLDGICADNACFKRFCDLKHRFNINQRNFKEPEVKLMDKVFNHTDDFISGINSIVYSTTGSRKERMEKVAGRVVKARDIVKAAMTALPVVKAESTKKHKRDEDEADQEDDFDALFSQAKFQKTEQPETKADKPETKADKPVAYKKPSLAAIFGDKGNEILFSSTASQLKSEISTMASTPEQNERTTMLTDLMKFLMFSYALKILYKDDFLTAAQFKMFKPVASRAMDFRRRFPQDKFPFSETEKNYFKAIYFKKEGDIWDKLGERFMSEEKPFHREDKINGAFGAAPEKKPKEKKSKSDSDSDYSGSEDSSGEDSD